MATTETEHLDLFGQQLMIGDCVVYPRGTNMTVGTVIKLHPKMVGVKGVNSRWDDCKKYSTELVQVSGAEVTMYLLKKTKIK